ncbi:MAG: phage holin family protein, partial [Sinobacteraceae bacterium]|nr:phage holin family protein [Nevskiaceae bacterium]
MIDRVSAAGSILVRHVSAYAELVRTDLDASTQQLGRRFVATGVLAAASFLAVAVACAWLIGATWDSEARVWVLSGLVMLFAGVALLAYWRLMQLRAQQPRLLALTSREWAKDRQLLEELLQRDRAEA